MKPIRTLLIYLFACATVMVFSCNSGTTETNITEADSTTAAMKADTIPSDTILTDGDMVEEYATFYILIVDTGRDYYSLNSKMFALNTQLKIPIDTMGRYFDKTKNLIALPDDDEDELYAGDYFPRRFPSEHLSLEYLAMYKENVGDKTMALVSAIYQYERDADSALAILKQAESKGFKLKAEVYVGCMH